MQNKRYYVIIAILLTLTACGQMGPLSLPDPASIKPVSPEKAP